MDKHPALFQASTSVVGRTDKPFGGREVRLVRNVFYVSGAIIGAGLLLYFAIGVASIVYVDRFHMGRSSLPSSVRVSKGKTYNVTPDCPITVLLIAGNFPDSPYAKIRSRTMGADFDRSYQIGDRIECMNSPGMSIEAKLESIDYTNVHFVFEWDRR